MNAFLRDRLIIVEKLFLIAVVAQDQTTAEAYSLELSSLIQHFKTVEASRDLDDNTTLLLARVSQIIRSTTQCVLECEDALKDAQTRLASCFSLPLPSDDLLPVSTTHPASTPYPLLFSHVSSSGVLGILGHNKLLDACAHRWLMRNMHNPYPTSTQLRMIGDESMTSVAQAEIWFQEARELIGWTRLSDEFFTGSLSATVTVAKRVYLEHDNTIPFCIAFAFSAVKASVETLFAEHPALPTSLTSYIGCSAEALRPVSVVNDSTLSTDLLGNEEIEDTTPPPSVAGCKRSLPEDTATSLVSDLHRPLKRPRVQSLHQVHPHSASMHPSSSTGPSSKKGATEALSHTSVTSVQLSDPTFQLGSKPSQDFLTSNSTGQRQTDINDTASEMVVASSDQPASQVKMRDQRISEGSPLVPSEQQLGPSPDHRRYPSPGSVPTFPESFSLSSDRSLTGEPSRITVSPGALVDLSVFDWSSITCPMVETSVPMNKPASVYVPSSDLAAMNYELPDPLYLNQSTEKGYNQPCSLDGLASLGDFSLLQFPIPTTFPSDISVSPPASFCLDNSTLPLPEMDWSITDFINEFSSFSAETSSAPSPSATVDAAPSTPENLIGSLPPPLPHEVNKPISVLDPSIPPSVLLPAEPGIFTEDASSMWSLLCGLS